MQVSRRQSYFFSFAALLLGLCVTAGPLWAQTAAFDPRALEGAWAAGMGPDRVTLTFSGNTCSLGMNGQQMQGMWDVAGDCLNMRFQNGQTISALEPTELSLTITTTSIPLKKQLNTPPASTSRQTKTANPLPTSPLDMTKGEALKLSTILVWEPDTTAPFRLRDALARLFLTLANPPLSKTLNRLSRLTFNLLINRALPFPVPRRKTSITTTSQTIWLLKNLLRMLKFPQLRSNQLRRLNSRNPL